MKLVATIPAYNEEKTIGAVIREIPREIAGVDSVEVLVLDDGSTDGTVGRAKEAGADNIVSHKKNAGLGVAFKDGLEAALEMGADIIVNIDGDGQYNAEEIPRLIEPLLENSADIVLGWRDIDSLDFMPRSKKIGNKIATWITNRVCESSIPIKDAQSGFRALNREAVLRINLSGRYTYVQETIIEAQHKGLKIEQIPIEFRPRVGKSRLIPNVFTYARRAGAIIFGTYWAYHPLKILSLIGAAFIFTGAAFGVYILVHYIQTGKVSPNLAAAVTAPSLITIGLQALIIGLFADALKGQKRFQEEILYRLKRNQSDSNK